MTLAEIDARLAEIEQELEVCRAATPGPWDYCTEHRRRYIEAASGGLLFDGNTSIAENTVFVATARDGYPRALENERSLLRALKAALKSCLAIPSMHHPVAFAHGFWGALSAEKKSAETEVQP